MLTSASCYMGHCTDSLVIGTPKPERKPAHVIFRRPIQHWLLLMHFTAPPGMTFTVLFHLSLHCDHHCVASHAPQLKRLEAPCPMPTSTSTSICCWMLMPSLVTNSFCRHSSGGSRCDHAW